MDNSEQILYQRVRALVARYPPSTHRRILIALAGSPGSGKTTISSALQRSFNETNAEQIQIIPMDGFHFPRHVLSTIAASPECPFQRRGAPFTFDARAFVALVAALRASTATETPDPARDIWVPSFDHAKKDPVERDICVPSTQQIIIFEGNYLLLDQEPWREIKGLVDETWFVTVSREEAKERLIVRHIAAGIESDRLAAERRAEENDLKNADLIIRQLLPPDVIVAS